MSDLFSNAISAFGAYAGYKQGKENLQLQKDAYTYQKSLNQMTMDREDNAVQRRAADLQKAGLSKTLAAGTAADTSSYKTGSAPQNDTLDRVSQGITLGQQFADLQKTLNEARNLEISGEKVKSETDYVNNQILNLGLQNAILEADVNALPVKKELLDISLQQAGEDLLNSKNYNADYNLRRTAQVLSNSKLTSEQKIASIKASWQDKMSSAEYDQLSSSIVGKMLENQQKDMETMYMGNFWQKMPTSQSDFLLNNLSKAGNGFINVLTNLGNKLVGNDKSSFGWNDYSYYKNYSKWN